MKTTTPKYIIIGKFMKRARVKAKLSQGDVRDLLGYKTPQIISDWERGICGVPTNALAGIRKAYGLSEDEIINVILNAERKELERVL